MSEHLQWCRSLRNDFTDASCNCESERKNIERKPTYEQLESELARLRKAIEELLCMPDCDSMDWNINGPNVDKPCNCEIGKWKRNALES